MIFDGQEVTKLVIEWQKYRNCEVLNDILAKSHSLVEVIVSGYDHAHRDDMIQEAYLRIQYALPFYASRYGTLHNFLTTVIHNICATYMKKASSYNHESIDDAEYDILDDINHTDIATEQDVLEYIRSRYTTIPAVDLDEIVEMIYFAMMYEDRPKNVILSITSNTSITKQVVTSIYNSIQVYIRYNMLGYAKKSVYVLSELNVLNDLRYVVGETLFNEIMIVFSGINIKIPS